MRKVPIRLHDSFQSCYRALEQRGSTLFALAPEAEKALSSATLPRNSAFIFGNEEFGLDLDTSLFPDIVPLSIPQFGQVQSLNVSNAAAIVMYEYTRQHSP